MSLQKATASLEKLKKVMAVTQKYSIMDTDSMKYNTKGHSGMVSGCIKTQMALTVNPAKVYKPSTTLKQVSNKNR